LTETSNAPLQTAVDVGCGTGQSTIALAPHFKEVIGFDVSKAQIEEAKKDAPSNVTYNVGTSETISLSGNSVQLITGSQCHHWFDLAQFYKEAKRILVPNGVMCFYFYSLPQPAVAQDPERTKNLQSLVDQAYRVDSKQYWDTRRQVVDKGFDGIVDFPFANIVRENLFSENDITLGEYLGYITSWSAYQVMKREDENKAKHFIQKLESDMKSAMGEDVPVDQIKIKLHLNYFVIMGRN